MISRIQTIHVASATSLVPSVNENVTNSTIGTTNPATNAPRMSLG